MQSQRFGVDVQQQSHHCVQCGDAQRVWLHSTQQPHAQVLLGQAPDGDPKRHWQLTELLYPQGGVPQAASAESCHSSVEAVPPTAAAAV